MSELRNRLFFAPFDSSFYWVYRLLYRVSLIALPHLLHRDVSQLFRCSLQLVLWQTLLRFRWLSQGLIEADSSLSSTIHLENKAPTSFPPHHPELHCVEESISFI